MDGAAANGKAVAGSDANGRCQKCAVKLFIMVGLNAVGRGRSSVLVTDLVILFTVLHVHLDKRKLGICAGLFLSARGRTNPPPQAHRAHLLQVQSSVRILRDHLCVIQAGLRGGEECTNPNGVPHCLT